MIHVKITSKKPHQLHHMLRDDDLKLDEKAHAHLKMLYTLPTVTLVVNKELVQRLRGNLDYRTINRT